MAQSGKSRSALLIEDEKLDYVGLRGLLLGSDSGITRLDWIQEWTGVEEVLARDPYDVYFVDLHLGPVSGLSIIRELRTNGILAPVIALTGHADDQVDRACTAAGASDFLVKGDFDRRALERSVRYATRSAAIHGELDRVNAVLERRMSAEAEQARLMRFAIEQSADGIFISKANTSTDAHIIVYANVAFCTLLGRRSGDLLGADTAALFAKPSSPAFETLTRILAGGDSHVGEYVMAGAMGTVQASVRASPLRSASGEITHFVCACRDVAEQHRLSEIDRRREKLEAVGQLTAGVAHDFNNVLTAVLGNLELLDRKLLDAQHRKLLANAARAAGRGAKLTEQLLTFGRHRQDGRIRIDLDTLVDGMDDLLAHSIASFIQVDHVRADDLWPVMADLDQLELAVLNLAINARDAMPLGGTLRIACANVPADSPNRLSALTPGQDYVCLSVKDAGVGMTPEVLSRAREPFFTTKPAGIGGGMGLAQVQATTEQAGGMFHLDSEVGRGTKARIFLPRDLRVVSAEPAPTHVSPPSIAGLCVLVADGDRDVRGVIVASLRGLGCRVLEAATAQKALELSRQETGRLDAILTDHDLSDSTGEALARQVRLERPGLPVLFVADSVRTEAAINDLGTVRVVRKPFTTIDLAATLALAVGLLESTTVVPFRNPSP